jgi:hypothetical protein
LRAAHAVDVVGRDGRDQRKSPEGRDLGVGENDTVLVHGGRHASIADPEVQEADGRWMWVRPDGAGLARLAAPADDGKLSVDVEHTYALEELPEAFARSQEGHVHGKLAVRISGD